MFEMIVPVIVGIAVIVLGVINLKGNISTLHWYHRQRVSEADRVPFGRAVGTGTILVGAAIVLKSCFQLAAEKMNAPALDTVGNVALAAGLAVGLAIILYAIIKYNKGLF